MPININRDDADGARGNRRFDLVEVQDIGVIHINEHGPGAEMDERFHRGKGGVAGHNDLVTRANPLKLVQQIDDQRPGRAEDALFGAGVGGQFSFKSLALLAKDVLAGAQGAQGSFLDFRIQETLG